MTEISITRREAESRGRYLATLKGHDGSGELTYSRLSPGKIVADHTFVEDSLRGTGVAKALVERLVNDARTEGATIMPACSYVRALFHKHPEWSDVMAN